MEYWDKWKTLGYSLGGWMVEAENLEWAGLHSVGILLVLSREQGVGLFTAIDSRMQP